MSNSKANTGQINGACVLRVESLTCLYYEVPDKRQAYEELSQIISESDGRWLKPCDRVIVGVGVEEGGQAVLEGPSHIETSEEHWRQGNEPVQSPWASKECPCASERKKENLGGLVLRVRTRSESGSTGPRPSHVWSSDLCQLLGDAPLAGVQFF